MLPVFIEYRHSINQRMLGLFVEPLETVVARVELHLVLRFQAIVLSLEQLELLFDLEVSRPPMPA